LFNIVKEWAQRNCSSDEVSLFAEIAASQNEQENQARWIKNFTAAKYLMHLAPSNP